MSSLPLHFGATYYPCRYPYKPARARTAERTSLSAKTYAADDTACPTPGHRSAPSSSQHQSSTTQQQSPQTPLPAPANCQGNKQADSKTQVGFFESHVVTDILLLCGTAVGIYAILLQFLIVSLVSGILTFAAPKIVAIAIPDWGPYIFGGLCLLVSVVQIFGFFGVYRERPSLFKNYARLNATLVSFCLIVAVAFIALSASRHSIALSRCQASFSAQVGNSGASAATAVQSGSEICNIWTWVQVGIMGLLFIIVLFVEVYFLMYQGIYASEQKLDHARYETVVEQAAEEIRQSGLWDHAAGRPSAEYVPGALGYSTHARTASGLRNEISTEPSREHLSDDAYSGAYRDEPNYRHAPSSSLSLGGGGGGGTRNGYESGITSAAAQGSVYHDDGYGNQQPHHQQDGYGYSEHHDGHNKESHRQW